MNIFEKHPSPKQRIRVFTLALMILSPMIFVGIYVSNIAGRYQEFLGFQYEFQPDASTFIEGDFDLMDEWARFYDDQYVQFHMPLNLTCYTTFTNTTYTEVESYHYTDNSNLYTGLALTGWVYHYLAAINENNQTDQDYALENIRKMVDGFSMLVKVPNGGLGPEYPGNLARGYASPEQRDIYPQIFEEEFKHTNGTGIYSDWRWRGFTSNDEYGGFYLAMAIVLKYIPDVEIQTTVKLIVDQVAQYMIENNFLGIHWAGGPSGVNQKPTFGNGGFWIPTLLKLATIANPEKYEGLYYHYCSKENVYLAAKEAGDQETIANYYAYNFGQCVVLAYLLLEGTETELGQHFYQGYLESFRHYTANHRNAWFNVAYLAIAGLDTDTSVIEGDIIDQLMRFGTYHPRDIGTLTVPIPDDFPTVDIDSDVIAYMNLIGVVRQPDEIIYSEPLTVEYQSSRMFQWSRTPWKPSPQTEENLLFQSPGFSYTLPYWMGRALGFIQPPGGS